MLHEFTADELTPPAWEYYLETCGLAEVKSDKHRRMLERSKQVLGEILPLVKVRAVTVRFDGGCLAGNTLALDGVQFSCPAFGRLEPERINAVYAYVLTAGEVRLETANVSDMLFADIWGTSFTDAGIDMLRQRLTLENDGYIMSPSFGPGFYGMGMDMLPAFFKLLDTSEIGVALKSGRLLLPLKSCAGFIMAVQDVWRLPVRDCADCMGNPGGCRFCKNYNAVV